METDDGADAGYVALTKHPVARTDRFADSVLVDLDSASDVVGVELVALSAIIDVDGIADRYGLSHNRREALRGPWNLAADRPISRRVTAGCPPK